MKGKLVIDLLSSIPFDYVGLWFTGERPEYLSFFALLKLVRIARLNKMITSMNAKNNLKTSFKLL